MRSTCLFCGIAQGSTPAFEVFRNDRLVAFLDTGPIRDGHVQIIPHDHYTTFDDLPAGLASEIMHLAQKLARAQKKLYGVDRVGFVFTGGDIPHAHAHLVPLVANTDITSRRYIAEAELTWRAMPTPTDEAMAGTADALAAMLAELEG